MTTKRGTGNKKKEVDRIEKPVIYQLFPRLFGNRTQNPVAHGTIEQNGSGKLNQITDCVIDEIKKLGFTHIWLTGVIEHAHRTDYSKYGITPDNPHVVKGNAGSPYAISDYYDIDPDIAEDVEHRMEEFEACVERIHAAGMKVLIDFVPNHVARRYCSDVKPSDAPGDLGEGDDDSVSFAPDNNFYYLPGERFAPYVNLGSGEGAYVEEPAKASGNDCFTKSPGVNDWYETVKLNYGVDYRDGSKHFDPVPSTWIKMTHILKYWAGKGVDGFRCDMAHLVPTEFWASATESVRRLKKETVFIAEIYDVNLYRDYIFKGGFDYLYDKVNLYDSLRAIQTCGAPASILTGCWMAVDGIEKNMLNFLENHDEQRYASCFYAIDPAKAVPALAVSAYFGRGAMMVYAGQELGERGADSEGFSGMDGRTTIFDYWSIPTLRRWLGNDGVPSDACLTPREIWLKGMYGKILGLCNSCKAIAEGAFFDVMYVNGSNATINPRQHYIFLRSTGKESVVVAVNFSGESADMAINIPQHAFDTLGIKPGRVKCKELLSGAEYDAELSSSKPLRVFVPAFGAAVVGF